MAEPRAPDSGTPGSRRLELTIAAQVDLTDIFHRSAEVFGARARSRYEALVAAALADLLIDPLRPGSVDRPELAPNLRTYHLRNARARSRTKGSAVGKPRHLIAYEFDEARLLILRVLHDAMDLSRHVGAHLPDQ